MNAKFLFKSFEFNLENFPLAESKVKSCLTNMNKYI